MCRTGRTRLEEFPRGVESVSGIPPRWKAQVWVGCAGGEPSDWGKFAVHCSLLFFVSIFVFTEISGQAVVFTADVA